MINFDRVKAKVDATIHMGFRDPDVTAIYVEIVDGNNMAIDYVRKSTPPTGCTGTRIDRSMADNDVAELAFKALVRTGEPLQ